MDGRFRLVLYGWGLVILRFELQEAEEGAGDLAVECDFVAQKEFVDAHAIGGIFPGQDGA